MKPIQETFKDIHECISQLQGPEIDGIDLSRRLKQLILSNSNAELMNTLDIEKTIDKKKVGTWSRAFKEIGIFYLYWFHALLMGVKNCRFNRKKIDGVWFATKFDFISQEQIYKTLKKLNLGQELEFLNSPHHGGGMKSLVSQVKVSPDFFKFHLMSLINFMRLFIKTRRGLFAGKDFALSATFRGAIDLKFFVDTNSNYSNHAIFFEKKFPRSYTHVMFWYSTNSHFPLLRNLSIPNEETSKFEVPLYHYFLTDVNIVWDQRQKEWLQQFPYSGNSIIEGPTVGKDSIPFVWTEKKPFISVFDVTPVSPEFSSENYGNNYNYFNSTNMNSFLNTICHNVSRFGYDIVLKHKREHLPFHSKDYETTVKLLHSVGKLDLVEPRTNVEEIIQKSVGVICFPFTSPFHFAKKFGKPVVYLDPTGELNRELLIYKDLQILYPDELDQWLASL